METLHTLNRRDWSIHVLILPMRNGNKVNKESAIHIKTGSYPTYEEWKRNLGISSNTTLFVLILPMRNGNKNLL